MIKPNKLHVGDKVAIISLSSGILGEPFAAHELVLGEKRLTELGLQYEYMPHAKKGIEFIKNHPEARAADLKQAFSDESIKGIVCAIGGDDTYRTIPFLLDDPEFIELVKNNPKIFLGFSDTTNNHLMFYKLGLQTYYGQAFLTDLAEFGDEMLPYTKAWTQQLFGSSAQQEIMSSPVWYEEPKSFGPEQVGVSRISHKEVRGFEVLHGSGVVEGPLLGGCIESLYDMLTSERYADEKEIIEKYSIFPSAEEWRGKVLFAESSEEKPTPEKLQKMLDTLAETGVFSDVSAVLVGKPQDEAFYEEYKTIWTDVAKSHELPVLFNFNIGHAAPRCILPYGGLVEIDFKQAKVFLQEPLVTH